MKPCMTPDEYAAWEEANAQTWGSRVTSPCSDCIPAFALEQRAIGKCDGVPGGVQDDPEVPPVPRYHLGLQAQRAERIARAASLVASGLTQAQTARAMGVQPSTISHYLRDGEAA